tara:strand:- start:215 stop:409 length:195 start_codon:yes stop_codon:yes gene_type:complete
MFYKRNAILLKNYFNKVISNKKFVKYNILKKKYKSNFVQTKKNKKSYIPDKNDYYEGSFDAHWP